MGTQIIYRTVRCIIDVECEIEVETWRACRGAREGGLQLEPDEPAGCEIQSITAAKGAFIVKGQDIDFDEVLYFDKLENDVFDELNS